MYGRHCVKTWSATQGAVALSSAEAEYYALVEGATRAKGLHSIARETGILREIVMATDSSGAKAFASRRVSGRMRHVEVC